MPEETPQLTELRTVPEALQCLEALVARALSADATPGATPGSGTPGMGAPQVPPVQAAGLHTPAIATFNPLVKQSVIDSIVDGKFEAENLVKLPSRPSHPGYKRGQPVLLDLSSGTLRTEHAQDVSLTESGLPKPFLKAFPNCLALLEA
ncbi:hypothetical protein GLOTRDRAFT_134489 [Gloeophyllum trabeum ATCC 11539]|uniref:Uncharacterized protein n=1 Tax=Gloeophyllum trabeum (strain ATCC 11539 / FP-39264 / Madison 617) TaxID=670483 RepID=S7PPS5_GLOTA|nr:uncharacterized protein GLOTRDRAFT_134489 [Gloeophyllum trabeum ATCC 11539]EPQ49891.1 hypothetical protein GLOTRDRAFT_134489 [Gloeophyllum trabeum ATCC 11539]